MLMYTDIFYIKLQIDKKRGCPKSNERYTKCGGFDKLNHRNANLLFSPLFKIGVSLTHLVSRRRGGSRKRWTDAAPLASWFAYNYSVGRFLRVLLSFTACPSPTLCLADGAARAKGGRTLRHSRPGLQIITLLDVF